MSVAMLAFGAKQVPCAAGMWILSKVAKPSPMAEGTVGVLCRYGNSAMGLLVIAFAKFDPFLMQSQQCSHLAQWC